MYFSIGKTTYAYHTYGEGTPIVLLHGFTGSSLTWSPFIAESADDFQVITIDLIGHGKTKSSTERSMEEVCHDLHKLFEHLELESFHLLGYSMGGRVALSYAVLYPGRILSMVLESASPGLRAKEERSTRRKTDEELAKKLEKEGIERFVSFWENISLFESQRSLAKDVQRAVRDERLSQSPDGLAQSLRSIGTGSQPSWWEKLSTLHLPVLLLVGEIDEKFILINEKMHKMLPNSEIIIINDAGHAIHVEQPEKFGRMVREFIN